MDADSVDPAALEPAIQLLPKTMLRTAVAVALFGIAMHYLVSGRKEANVSKMVTGAMLMLASLAVL